MRVSNEFSRNENSLMAGSAIPTPPEQNDDYYAFVRSASLPFAPRHGCALPPELTSQQFKLNDPIPGRAPEVLLKELDELGLQMGALAIAERFDPDLYAALFAKEQAMQNELNPGGLV